jgi:hypothetical protein
MGSSSYDEFQSFLVFQISPGLTIIYRPLVCLSMKSLTFSRRSLSKGFTASRFSATITLYYTRNAAFGVVYSAFFWQAWEMFCLRRKVFLSRLF